MTYTHPDKAPEGHKWQTEDGAPVHWTGGYTRCGRAVFDADYPVGLLAANQNGWSQQARIIDARQRPLEIPWDVIKDEWICAAADLYGSVHLYTGRPLKGGRRWIRGGYIGLSEAVKFERGDMPWDQSLVWRPGHEPEGGE